MEAGAHTLGPDLDRAAGVLAEVGLRRTGLVDDPTSMDIPVDPCGRSVDISSGDWLTEGELATV